MEIDEKVSKLCKQIETLNDTEKAVLFAYGDGMVAQKQLAEDKKETD